jgi:hypothetical protein
VTGWLTHGGLSDFVVVEASCAVQCHQQRPELSQPARLLLEERKVEDHLRRQGVKGTPVLLPYERCHTVYISMRRMMGEGARPGIVPHLAGR